MEDMQLLGQYAHTGCQDSFERLVTRHMDWVFSVCLRGVKDRHLAEDVTQAVFIILARKAKTLSPNTVLRGWLFKAARFAVADALKKQNRHKRHVQRAAEMGATDLSPQEAATWDRMAPALEEAVACLSEKDRQAIMLRFYESKNLAEVGVILGISEEAAKKRVSRAVEKLRMLLSREGVAISAALLLLLLTSRAAEAAPLGLGLSISSAATGSSVASGMASAIANGAIRQMRHATGRLLAALAASTLLMLIASVLMANLVGANLVFAPRVSEVVRTSSPRPISKLIDSAKLDRFEDIWVGTKEKILWQFHRSTDDADVPGTIRDDLSISKLYAVAVDREGMTWVKKLNRELLVSDETTGSANGQSNSPTAITCSDDLLALLLDDFKSTLGGGGKLLELQPGALTSAERKEVLQSAELPNLPSAGDVLGDHQWHQLTPKLRKDGSLAEDLPTIRMQLNPNSGLFDNQSDPRFTTVVPEPASAAAILLLGGMLFSRRRQKKN